MTTTGIKGAYRPSWIDRINTWVDQLPLLAWVFYLLCGIALILVQVLVLWIDGGLDAVELLPIIVFNALAIPYLLALVHAFDRLAVSALEAMRTVLTMKPAEYSQFEYSLSTMPFPRPLLAGLFLTMFTILTPLVTASPVRYAALEQLPVFSIVFHIIDKGSAFLLGALLYHTIRQLRLVNDINSNHVRVNLYRLGPLQSFSKLTAATALSLMVFVYLWMLINPELLADPLLLGYVLAFTFLAALVFIWPLWGAHRLMQTEKNKVLHELDLRFEAIFSNFNQLVQEHDYAAADKLNGTIATLDIEYRKIDAIPTWPWSSETARVVLTAIALPLLLMIIQFFVMRALS